jgi:TPR repeat protein
MLAAGKGVEQDTVRAAGILEKACDGGVKFACTGFANLLVTGNGVVIDRAKARDMYEKGCGDDNPTGCYVYAARCAAGTFGGDWANHADALYRRACDLGYADSCAALAQRLEHRQGTRAR